MPPELAAELRALTVPYGRQRKWMVVAAGMLMYLGSDEQTRERVIGEISRADATRTFGELIEAAKSRTTKRPVVRSLQAPEANGPVGAKPVKPPRRRRR